ncbi:DNA internalization-related competence protein ComEC/Rec2 [Gracilibacillus oryzae]|uniref:DNA internalization-related competence protein ComEC/Rec2 n=1 Tax=Gracilibacillus oryzae TaxID=1672701 RepID=A0A7C8GRS9_9BACI|nr:DNA internalization-related competence protein ComEC/Rec2 [Gracilibacillus oryzae]KAB8127567.1 DNA internalization-related competence protein ComEC/Rec2 [Gracilibacillus oryzae]
MTIKLTGHQWFSIILGCLLIYFIRTKRWTIRFAFVVFAFFLISYVLADPPDNRQTPVQPSSNITLQGRISSDIIHSNTYSSFNFQIKEQNTLIKVYYFPDQESSSDKKVKTLRHGSLCTVNGSFQTDLYASNPGEFDYGEFLSDQGIAGQFVISDMQKTNCEGQSFLQHLYDWRNQLLEQVNQHADSFTYGWINALLFGDRKQLPEATITLFQDWGLSHLLAISGLHVGLLLTCLYFFGLYVIQMTREQMQWIVALILPVYPVIAGAAPSVWRASILALLLILFKKWKVSLHTSSVLSFVFLAMVWTDPSIVNALAFQFSFIVTYAILFSKKIITDEIGNGWIILRISLISLLIILPLQLNAFYQFQPLTVLLNLMVIPYFSLFVLPILLIIICSVWAPFLVRGLSSFFYFIHDNFLQILHFIDQNLSYSWTVGTLPPVYIAVYYGILLVFFILLEKKMKLPAFFIGVLLAVSMMIISALPYFDSNGRITFLDMGQGDAIVVELPYRSGVFLIDAGAKMNRDFTSPSSTVYEQVIRPYLMSRGISRLDAIILSHGDTDHIGSVSYILEDYPVNYLITSSFFDKQTMEEYKHINNDFIYLEAMAGSQITIGDYQLDVLHPTADTGDSNENSLVFSASFGELTWLFTGDIGEESEQMLINMYPDLHTDVLKVAHHGSGTSTSDAFLKATMPQFSIISVGRENRYGHPDQEVVERLEQSGNTILRTDKHGAVTYIFNQRSGTFSTYLPYDTVYKQESGRNK